jgi:hypothetical protein
MAIKTNAYREKRLLYQQDSSRLHSYLFIYLNADRRVDMQ